MVYAPTYKHIHTPGMAQIERADRLNICIWVGLWSNPLSMYVRTYIIPPNLYSKRIGPQITIPPKFEPRRGHIWRMFHIWLHFITFGGRSADLTYHVHKSGLKTLIIIMITKSYFHSCHKKNHSMWKISHQLSWSHICTHIGGFWYNNPTNPAMA